MAQDTEQQPLNPREEDPSNTSNRRHHNRRHHHHGRRSSGRRGQSPQQPEIIMDSDGEGSSGGSGSESGSTSCSTASEYSVDYPEPRGHRHRHRHHRSRHSTIPDTATSPSRGTHIPLSRRSTAGYSRRVVIEDPAEDSNESGRHSRRRSTTRDGSTSSSEDHILDDVAGDDENNVRARQEALNTRHPFGLPIWKPALYKKSRSVTRAAFLALHARPLQSGKLFLKPGNIAWMLLAGWWLLLVCLAIAIILLVVPYGGRHYARVAGGLGWYLLWPFGRYVERIKDSSHNLGLCTLSANDLTEGLSSLEAGGGSVVDDNEDAPLLGGSTVGSAPETPIVAPIRHAQFRKHTALGRAVYYTILVTILNPLLIAVSAVAWFGVFSIPMGKLTHTLARYLWRDPLSLHFRSGDMPTVKVPRTQQTTADDQDINDAEADERESVVEQPAPTVLLCTNEAVGWYYYKYTVDGVNILFYNMLSMAIFVLIAAFVIAPLTDHKHFLVQPGVLFPLCLVSTIPLAYFIGQAVSSISAQSSLGLGAVINATFGSIVEVILYSIALTQGKSRLVEGALIGSLLAGLMLMPGLSMIAGGVKHKVQRFNAKSAEVTATLVIMSIIGAFAPTLFYQTFAVPEFECEDEVTSINSSMHKCKQKNVEYLDDPFYQETVKPFMYFCTAILPLSYLIALWFSLKTHVKHIYSSGGVTNPILKNVLELFRRAVGPDGLSRIANRAQRSMRGTASASRADVRDSSEHHLVNIPAAAEATVPGPLPRTSISTSNIPEAAVSNHPPLQPQPQPQPPTTAPPRMRRMMSTPHHSGSGGGYASVPSGQHVSSPYDPANAPSSLPNVPRLSELPRVLAADPDDQLPDLALLERVARGVAAGEGSGGAGAGGGHGGHDAPNWSKAKSAFILCFCTVLFSLVAEVLVDTVDVVIQGLGIREKYIGLTLFALVPNVTEFLNAIAFAVQNNIALSIEISNAYTVQVALLQIPILVFFSAFYGVPDFANQPPSGLINRLFAYEGQQHLPTDASSYVFALLFPRWDLISILFCVFLLTYMLIEGKANYFKGSILCLSYFVWMVGYAFEPVRNK